MKGAYFVIYWGLLFCAFFLKLKKYVCPHVQQSANALDIIFINTSAPYHTHLEDRNLAVVVETESREAILYLHKKINNYIKL
jgi:hypothetical protein